MASSQSLGFPKLSKVNQTHRNKEYSGIRTVRIGVIDQFWLN
jgi:hypothetical protein